MFTILADIVTVASRRGYAVERRGFIGVTVNASASNLRDKGKKFGGSLNSRNMLGVERRISEAEVLA